MGQIICVSYDDLLPGEGLLYQDRLWNAITFAESGKKMAPVPVRRIRDKYVHLDSRHRLIYHYLTGTEPEFYLAHDWYDHMRKDQFEHVSDWKLAEINENILVRWDEVEKTSKRLKVKNYHEHFRNLRKQYKFLKDYETCRAYLNRRFA